MVASTILRGEEGVPTGSADTWAVPMPGASLPAPCLIAEGTVPGGSGQSHDGYFEGFLCDHRLLGAGLCPAPLFSEQSLPEVWAASGSVQTDVWAHAGRDKAGHHPPPRQVATRTREDTLLYPPRPTAVGASLVPRLGPSQRPH